MNKSKIFAASMAAGMALSMLSPVAAMAEGMTYTPVAGSQVSFQKYLVMKNQANVPNVTFNYAIRPGAAQTAKLANGTIEVYAGDDANKVTGAPTIGSVTFQVSDKDDADNYGDTVKDLPATDGVQAGAGKDMLTLQSGEVYARHPINVNFSGVRFKEPGIYRYIVTESNSNSLGIDNDNDQERILDVYVKEENNALVVDGYALHNNAATAVVKQDGSDTAGKPQGYTNRYVTYDLNLAKTVSGNQASHDEYFKFTVTISGAVAGTKYNVSLAPGRLGTMQGNADVNTKTNAINLESHQNPTFITAGDDGSVTQEFWLQQGQNLVIQGLARGTAYEVHEDSGTMANEGYKVTTTISGDTKVGGLDAASDVDVRLNESTLSMADTSIQADTIVTYNNERKGTIPTGVILTVVPGVALGIAGLAGIAVMNRKKKEEQAD